MHPSSRCARALAAIGFVSLFAGWVAAQSPVASEAESPATDEQIERVIANLPGGRIARPASREDLTPEQERFVQGILGGPRNNMSASQAVMLASPTLGDLLQRSSAYARFAGTEGYSSLPPKLNELAILMAARFWRGEYIWNAHHNYAVSVGLDRAVVEAIRVGERPAAMEEDVKAIYNFLDELITTRHVSDAAFNAVREVLGGDRGVVDLVGTFALYSISSMVVTVDQSEVPGVTQPYFPASTQ
jgi:4-carboxymuconolactone decarboxylase